MNGKELVAEVIEHGNRVKDELEASDALHDDPARDELANALKELDGLKSKPSLRTKDGTNMVFPVKEAGDNLKDEWEDAKGDDADELKARIEEFTDAVNTLAGVLKSRTVIIT
jgi:hypothetical protein